MLSSLFILGKRKDDSRAAPLNLRAVLSLIVLLCTSSAVFPWGATFVSADGSFPYPSNTTTHTASLSSSESWTNSGASASVTASWGTLTATSTASQTPSESMATQSITTTHSTSFGSPTTSTSVSASLSSTRTEGTGTDSVTEATLSFSSTATLSISSTTTVSSTGTMTSTSTISLAPTPTSTATFSLSKSGESSTLSATTTQGTASYSPSWFTASASSSYPTVSWTGSPSETHTVTITPPDTPSETRTVTITPPPTPTATDSHSMQQQPYLLPAKVLPTLGFGELTTQQMIDPPDGAVVTAELVNDIFRLQFSSNHEFAELSPCATTCSLSSTGTFSLFPQPELVGCNTTHIQFKVFYDNTKGQKLITEMNVPTYHYNVTLTGCTLRSVYDDRNLMHVSTVQVGFLVFANIERPLLELAKDVVVATESSVAAAGVVAGLLGAAPVVAAQAGRLRIISFIGECGDHPDDTDLTGFESPTQLSFGPEDSPLSHKFVAALVMNTLLIGVVMLLHFLIVVIIKSRGGGKPSSSAANVNTTTNGRGGGVASRVDSSTGKDATTIEMLSSPLNASSHSSLGGSPQLNTSLVPPPSESMPLSGSSKPNQQGTAATDPPHNEWKVCMGKARFPSLHLCIVMLLLQPTVGTGIRAMSIVGGEVAWQTFFAFFTFLWVAMIILVGGVILLRFEAVRYLAKQNWRKKQLKLEPMTMAIFLQGRGYWVDKSKGSGFVTQYKFWFADYRNGVRWFIIVELAVCLICGILAGVRATDDSCKAIAGLITAVFGVYFVVYVALRPHSAMANTIVYSVSIFFEFLGAIFLTISKIEGVRELQPSGILLTLIATYLLMAKAFFDLILELVGIIKDRRRAARSAESEAKRVESGAVFSEELSLHNMKPQPKLITKRGVGSSLANHEADTDSDDERFVERELFRSKQPNAEQVVSNSTTAWMAEPLVKAPPPSKKEMDALYTML